MYRVRGELSVLSHVSAQWRARAELIAHSYIAYKVFLYYIYVETISYTPLASNYTALGKTSARDGAQPPFTWRRQYQLACLGPAN